MKINPNFTSNWRVFRDISSLQEVPVNSHDWRRSETDYTREGNWGRKATNDWRVPGDLMTWTSIYADKHINMYTRVCTSLKKHLWKVIILMPTKTTVAQPGLLRPLHTEVIKNSSLLYDLQLWSQPSLGQPWKGPLLQESAGQIT